MVTPVLITFAVTLLIGVPIAAALYRLLREELHRLERAEAAGSPKPQA